MAGKVPKLARVFLGAGAAGALGAGMFMAGRESGREEAHGLPFTSREVFDVILNDRARQLRMRLAAQVGADAALEPAGADAGAGCASDPVAQSAPTPAPESAGPGARLGNAPESFEADAEPTTTPGPARAGAEPTAAPGPVRAVAGPTAAPEPAWAGAEPTAVPESAWVGEEPATTPGPARAGAEPTAAPGPARAGAEAGLALGLASSSGTVQTDSASKGLAGQSGHDGQMPAEPAPYQIIQEALSTSELFSEDSENAYKPEPFVMP